MKVDTKIRTPKWDGTEPCVTSGADFFDYKETTGRKTKENVLWLKQFCDSCPMQLECATYAIKHEEYGFWGGMTEEQRKEFRKAHKIQLIRPEMVSEFMPEFSRNKKEENTNDNFNA